MRFRVKPREVEAVLFDGQLVGEPDSAAPAKVLPGTCPDWFPGVSRSVTARPNIIPQSIPVARNEVVSCGDLLLVGGSSGTSIARAGDWIVRGEVAGMLLVVHALVMERLYERV